MDRKRAATIGAAFDSKGSYCIRPADQLVARGRGHCAVRRDPGSDRLRTCSEDPASLAKFRMPAPCQRSAFTQSTSDSRHPSASRTRDRGAHRGRARHGLRVFRSGSAAGGGARCSRPRRTSERDRPARKMSPESRPASLPPGRARWLSLVLLACSGQHHIHSDADGVSAGVFREARERGARGVDAGQPHARLGRSAAYLDREAALIVHDPEARIRR